MKTYRIEWMGVVGYVSAPTAARAKMTVMRSAHDAGWWYPGWSLAGLKCRIADHVPPGEHVAKARDTPRSRRQQPRRSAVE